jgi:uncharacterized alkaline shock family protein YloU
LKIGCHFDTTKVIEAELQVAPNTITEHDFQDAFKNGRSAGNGVYVRKGTISRVMVDIRSKVSFDQTEGDGGH